MSWLERDSVPPEAASRADAAKRRSVKPPPLQKSARRETMQVRLEWLEGEGGDGDADPTGRRGARASEKPAATTPSTAGSRRKLPPPLPREEPDS
jgi:hypothetical protein